MAIISAATHMSKLLQQQALKATLSDTEPYRCSSGDLQPYLWMEKGCLALPWLFLGFYLPDDVFHPEHEIPNHAEKAELVSCVHQPHSAALTGIQQCLPCL